jgi:hypothetical protein
MSQLLDRVCQRVMDGIDSVQHITCCIWSSHGKAVLFPWFRGGSTVCCRLRMGMISNQ